MKKIIKGTPDRPRLYIFRSNKHIYGQIIDDTRNKILITRSSLSVKENNQVTGHANCNTSKTIGKLIAQACIDKGIQKIVFDRGKHIYHGRIKALAESARKAGIEF
uniref:Large ribosomal subunit protein uL18c n=1 Tax=Liagora brachyclada TaxID=1884665 RepID=A0A1G4P022_9FLOR|nr:Ribosomal protein L18 [Liagora brachyclada]SCW24258.1 Ribosomal protein L18 [Liagora brachyclada]